MTNQPELNLPKSTLENRLAVTAYLLVALHFSLAAYYYSQLPEQIPTHFNFSGKVDKMGDKTAIFHLPVVALILCIALALMAKFPHKLRHRNALTPINAAAEYRQTSRLLWTVNVLDSAFLLLLTTGTIRAAVNGGSLADTIWIVVALLVITPWLLLRFNK